MKPEIRAMSRRKIVGLFAAAAAAPFATPLLSVRTAQAASLPPVEVWKDPNCQCCGSWADHMRQAGFTLTIHTTNDMDSVKRAKGVPDELQACHTAVVDGYVLEGHAPADDVKKLLAERPSAVGLAVPGMPDSSPGMDQRGDSFEVILFGTPTGKRTYARYAG